eukprot:120230_1
MPVDEGNSNADHETLEIEYQLPEEDHYDSDFDELFEDAGKRDDRNSSRRSRDPSRRTSRSRASSSPRARNSLQPSARTPVARKSRMAAAQSEVELRGSQSLPHGHSKSKRRRFFRGDVFDESKSSSLYQKADHRTMTGGRVTTVPIGQYEDSCTGPGLLTALTPSQSSNAFGTSTPFVTPNDAKKRDPPSRISLTQAGVNYVAHRDSLGPQAWTQHYSP